MHDFKRADRVSELLREEISQIITQQVKDPLIGFVTVTNIKLTDDLKLARVYVSTLGKKDDREKSLLGLGRATSFIRSELGHKTNLKYVPELKFYYDETFDYAQNIESLLNEINKDDQSKFTNSQ